MQPSPGGVDPEPQAEPCPVRAAHQPDMSGLDKERSQILVAAFGDLAQDRAVAGRLLLGHQLEPGPKVPPLLEPGAGADCRRHGRRDDRPHPWHAHQALTVLILNSERFDLSGDRCDALIQVASQIWSRDAKTADAPAQVQAASRSNCSASEGCGCNGLQPEAGGCYLDAGDRLIRGEVRLQTSPMRALAANTAELGEATWGISLTVIKTAIPSTRAQVS